MIQEESTISDPVTFKELSAGLKKAGKYAHLQIILSKNLNRKFNQQYLMITHSELWSDFRLVNIIDADYKKGKAVLKIIDSSTEKKELISIDINDLDHSNVLFICWDDILKIVGETTKVNNNQAINK
jgi:hypothetical protein